MQFFFHTIKVKPHDQNTKIVERKLFSVMCMWEQNINTTIFLTIKQFQANIKKEIEIDHTELKLELELDHNLSSFLWIFNVLKQFIEKKNKKKKRSNKQTTQIKHTFTQIPKTIESCSIACELGAIIIWN